MEEKCAREEEMCEMEVKSSEVCEEKETPKIDELSCLHLHCYKKVNGLKDYSRIHNYFVSCNTASSLSRKYELCFCYICETRQHRLHACLICPFFGCYENNHIQEHSVSEQCPLAVDLTTGNIYCFICEDYVYDPEFVQFSRREQKKTRNYIASWFPSESSILVNKNEIFCSRDYRFLDPWIPLSNAMYVQNETSDPEKIDFSFFVPFVNKETLKEQSDMAVYDESTNRYYKNMNTTETEESNKEEENQVIATAKLTVEDSLKKNTKKNEASNKKGKNSKASKVTDSVKSTKKDSTRMKTTKTQDSNKNVEEKNSEPSKVTDLVKSSKKDSMKKNNTKTQDSNKNVVGKSSGNKKSEGDPKSTPTDLTPKYIPNTFGLRGLVNIRNTTCYLNSVLQVLTHIPCLRNVFLSLKHTPKTCRLRNEEGSVCLVCEMFLLTQEFFSNKTGPISAGHVFYLIWKQKFSTCSQIRGEIFQTQDAHEILILLLQLLHEQMKSADEEDDNCNCYIHQLFMGVLQKDISCKICGMNKSKLEEFHILSLNLVSEVTETVATTSEDSTKKNTAETEDSTQNMDTQCEISMPVLETPHQQGRNKISEVTESVATTSEDSTKKNTAETEDSTQNMDTQCEISMPVLETPRQRGRNKKTSKVTDSIKKNKKRTRDSKLVSKSPHLQAKNKCETEKTSQVLTLMQCIESYLKLEIIECPCDICKKLVQSEKIEKLHTTPVIMCFHFKRREYDVFLQREMKNSTYVSFPEVLDITPYSRVACFSNSAGCSKDMKHLNISRNRYCLVGVICHIGDVTGGHYISFIKVHGNWYECDDQKIYKVDKNYVLKSEAYILFYQKEKIQAAIEITEEEKEKIEATSNLILNKRIAMAYQLKEVLENKILKLEE